MLPTQEQKTRSRLARETLHKEWFRGSNFPIWNKGVFCKRCESDCAKCVCPPIPRGGLVPARILSELLSIPIELVASKGGGPYLIVDDISDSGMTMIRFVASLESSYITATLFMRQTTKYVPHFFVHILSHDEWISFPWEGKMLGLDMYVERRDATV